MKIYRVTKEARRLYNFELFIIQMACCKKKERMKRRTESILKEGNVEKQSRSEWLQNSKMSKMKNVNRKY